MCARTCRRPQRRCRGDHVQPCATMPRDAQRVGRKRRDPVTDLVADDAVAGSGDLVENARLPQQMKRVDHHADMNGREMLGEVERLVECGHDAPVGREDRMHRFYPEPHSAGAGFGRELHDRLGGGLAPHPDRRQSGFDTPASPSAGPTTRWCAGQRESIASTADSLHPWPIGHPNYGRVRIPQQRCIIGQLEESRQMSRTAGGLQTGTPW